MRPKEATGVVDADVSALAGRERRTPDVLLGRAREMRARQTEAEKALWEQLRDRRLGGAKFRRQHNVGPFIADFYCHQGRLIVEVDGPIHDLRREKDAVRDDWAQANGLRVLRFSNQQVLGQPEWVLAEIVRALGAAKAALTPGPSPCGSGERDANPTLPSPAGGRAGDEGRSPSKARQ